MSNNEYLNNQRMIFQDLLDATIKEYAKSPDKKQGDITIGAHGNVLSYRDSSQGILAGMIARAVLPVTDDSEPEGVISDLYPLESLMKADVFELHSFHNQVCTVLRYEDGERKEFHVYPDTAKDGLLVHLEWKTELTQNRILTINDIVNAIKHKQEGNHLPGKPDVWFNGIFVKYTDDKTNFIAK